MPDSNSTSMARHIDNWFFLRQRLGNGLTSFVGRLLVIH